MQYEFFVFWIASAFKEEEERRVKKKDSAVRSCGQLPLRLDLLQLRTKLFDFAAERMNLRQILIGRSRALAREETRTEGKKDERVPHK